MNRQMVAILVDQHCRNEFRRDHSLADSANRHFGNGNLGAETIASRLHPLADEPNHFEYVV
jgi:hypothetical protein